MLSTRRLVSRNYAGVYPAIPDARPQMDGITSPEWAGADTPALRFVFGFQGS